ncbi:MAG: 16S rRNA processing protein RimM [Gammaproteobacteria bacterium RIFCSPHIGHO2_12_FULL_40_19]|nr:MAG: 16S rRNA processing protein RimM [Gammaproteobacteria bacterium RIFCSPHIGHO2_12_FULL_40_19]
MSPKKIIIGRIGDAYGVKGWSHLISFTDPHENIFNYKNWQIQTSGDLFAPVKLESYKAHGNGYVIKIKDSNDRDQALLLKGKSLAIERSELPVLKKDAYYWSDLVGLAVINTKGESLGTIDHLFETGSNDVIATNTHVLIPYLRSVVKEVDLEKKTILVEWDAILDTDNSH